MSKLERQLGSKKRHWHQFGPNGLAHMVGELKRLRSEQKPDVQQCSKNVVKKSIKSKKLMKNKI